MTNFWNWIMKNKLAVGLIVVLLGYWLWNNSDLKYRGVSRSMSYNYGGVATDSYIGSAEMGMPQSLSVNSRSTIGIAPAPDYAPVSESANRMTVQNGSMSLLVADVRDTQQKISEYVTSQNGYVVNSSATRPTEQPYGTITVRVPADRLAAAFDYFRSLGMKVTSESLSGYDVTDQYEDLETKLGYLERSLAQIQAIQDRAETYEQILSGTREVINLQRQIDDLKGRQTYLEQTARLALVNIDMSTDELALPYAPDTNFRPALIFKMAVRSLMVTLQDLGGKIIWLAVYSVIWLPLLIIIFVLRRLMMRKSAAAKGETGPKSRLIS